MKFEIKHRWNSEVLFSIETDSWKLAVEAAIKAEADLSSADLSSADLRSADLRSANLRSANLRSANLRFADLSFADLSSADLSSANLSSANLRFADLSSANLSSANLSSANLRSANLRSANLRFADLSSANLSSAKNLPESFVNLCSRDMLFVFEHLRGELPYLREKLLKGEVNGTQYEGDCACLIGSLANARKESPESTCVWIPYYDMGLHNPAEQWFFQIKQGDTPTTNEFAAHALKLIDSVLEAPKKHPKSK